MLCILCNKNRATTFKGAAPVCPACFARSNRPTHTTTVTTFKVIDLTPQIRICENCGSDFSAYNKRGRLGCSDCYSAFRDQLTPIIRKIHGNARHRGTRPGGGA